MRHGSLFSGIGGFDLAAEWMGWENVFHCEIDSFCQKILKQHWPGSVHYSDITKTDFNEWRGKIDIISGGFPCQPYSTAGKRKGKADDRHLWPEMLRAIREIQPTWIVGENVPGLLNWQRGMVLAEIKADLEAAGFEVFPPVILPACGKNAPHRRERLWIIAHSKDTECKLSGDSRSGWSGITGMGGDGVTPNTHDNGLNGSNGEHEINASKGGFYALGNAQQSINNGTTTNSERIGQQGSGRAKGQLRKEAFGDGKASWSYDDGRWPTQSPVCGGNDGVSNRVHRIKALGNAVVPQVVYEIFKAIESF